MKKIAGILIASLCLALLIIAVFPGQGNADVIYGCVAKNGTLKIVSGPGQCASRETPLSWNSEGPQGPAGPPAPGAITTVLHFQQGNSLNSADDWTQYTFITPTNLPFVKQYDNSTIFVTWNDTLAGRPTGDDLGFCNWQIRIDGLYYNYDDVSMPVYPRESVYLWEYDTAVISHTVAFTFSASRIPAGEHDVQLWFSTINAGCFLNAGGLTRTITVVELP